MQIDRSGTKEALLILFGFLLGFIPPWLDRKRRLKAHIQAIRAEMQLAYYRATMLLKDNVMAPLYRLPVSSYQTSYPVLLAEGVLSEAASLALGNYFCQVQDINRGLDNATAMAHANDNDGIHREFDRLLLKGQRLLQDGPEGHAIYAAGLAIIEQLNARSWWKYCRLTTRPTRTRAKPLCPCNRPLARASGRERYASRRTHGS